MQKRSRRAGKLKDDVDRMRRVLVEMGDQVPADLWDRFNQLHNDSRNVDEELDGISTRVRRLQRSANNERASYEAMTVEMPKWRTAILLGLNSAAIAAVMANEHLPAEAVRIASLVFLVGVLTAFISGAVLENVGKSGLDMVAELDNFDIDEPSSPEDALSTAGLASKRLRLHWLIAELLRFISIGSFAAGVIFLALSN